MTEQQRRQIRAELARRMGYSVVQSPYKEFRFYRLVSPNGERSGLCESETEAWSLAPDPSTNAEHNRALVAWLAQDDARWKEFKQELLSDWVSSPEQDVVRFALTAPLETIAEAAWRAIQEEAK